MIGLYGGSFDPVHIGHLRIAEDIRESYRLDKVVFIPAYHSPLKRKSRAPAEDRLHMLKLSIQNNSFFEIDDIEIKRKGKSYNFCGYYKTLHQSSELCSCKFIVGTRDAFQHFTDGKSLKSLIDLTNFIVIGRGENTYKDVENYLIKNFPYMKLSRTNHINWKTSSRVYFFDSRRIDVSSTEIRRRIKTGKSIKYLVLPDVEKYILLKKLYRG
ncbi:MAG: nicotinate (nicotinamide) nucleotide adenylyltransferase [Persephonella sp.]|nr:nicotinate (nicotinamide) nucleotide adenylyltransferase [Persephonella sp.]